MVQQNIDGTNKNKNKESKNEKNVILNSFKKPFSYFNIYNDKHPLNSPTSETTSKYSELDNFGSESNIIPITENQIDHDEIYRMNHTKSIPSKFSFVPKNITINEQDSDNNNNPSEGQYDDITVNMNYIKKNSSRRSLVISNNNQKNMYPHPIFHQKTYPFIINASISKINKSKKPLLPWYLKRRRQISFSEKDIKTFYNYNKCSDYEKYENYFSNIHPLTKKNKKRENVDISLDKTAIELKELHFDNFKGNNNDQNYQQQQQSELKDTTDHIIEKEIAFKINGIVLNEVQTNTDNVFIVS
ncbi:hypothetical protein H8356DRAFT_1671366 [Neocallimastix lanati (nom. inval.)]|jgi:hypothetical protein|nr:hypothetical protein H8356DRAFT_1671366 [Neocallimastix sp. JGI-2020a]